MIAGRTSSPSQVTDQVSPFDRFAETFRSTRRLRKEFEFMNRSMLQVSLFRLFAFGLVAAAAGVTIPSIARAQYGILDEMYGKGVHAFHSGQYSEASNFLSMAIDNGIQDPRAYYFRGMVAAAQGRLNQAEADWQQGAELEAKTGQDPEVGRALARFQGSNRLKLEMIRHEARLNAMAMAAERSQQRYGEIEADQPAPSMGTPPAPRVTPPPVPPADFENPFSRETDPMAMGEPRVEADDALEGAMDPFADDPPSAAPADAGEPGASDPFGAPGGGEAADPFGAPGGGEAADPFGAPGGGEAADPFGAPAGGEAADPFGAPDAGEMDDPFGSDPFGN